MSRLFPHTSFVEDQPLSKTLLSTHVLYRGFQTGAILSPAFTFPRYYLSKSPKPPLLPLLLKNSGRGALIGTGVLTFGLVGRLWGKTEIEWKDRAWRLLENEWQMEVDDFSVVGSLVGVGVGLVGMRRGRVPVGRGMVLGSAAVGNVVGVGAYMIWRHGVKGGKFD